MIMPPVRATPGLKMMRPLIASSARRSSLLHGERWAPFLAIVYFYAYCLKKCLEMTKSSLLLCGSTTVETVETSTATVVRAMSWPYPPTPDPCECATCATPSCCREARPQRPDKAMKHWTHSTTVFHHSSTVSHLIRQRQDKFIGHRSGDFLKWWLVEPIPFRLSIEKYYST